MSIGPFEILVVLAVLALIIGPRRVTNMARSLGRGVQDFVTELSDKKAVGSKRPAIGDGDEEGEERSNKPSEEPNES